MGRTFGDLNVDMRNAAAGSGTTTGAAKTGKAKATVLQGTTYVTNTGFVFDDETITADHLFNYKTKNIYGRGIQRKMRTMLFNSKERYTVEMINNGVTDEEQSKILQGMCDAPMVNLWLRLQQTFDDVFWFGLAPFNPVLEWIGNAFTLMELRHLPPHTFKQTGQWEGKLKAQGHFLKGIGLVDIGGGKEELQFYQVEAGTSKIARIANIFSVKEPDCEMVAGDPIVFPVCPVLEMLKFSWNTRMQQVNRTGAPLMIAELPAGADENDLTATKKMLRNWSKDTTFIPPEGVKVTVIDIRDNTTVEEAIRMLAGMIIDYISPASMLNSGDQSNRLGGSDNAQQEMINQFIAGQLAWISNVWENFLTENYLIPNGYDPLLWKIVITIPSPSIDKSEVRLAQAQVGANYKVIHPNEVREMLDLPDADDKTLGEIKAAWDVVKPVEANPFGSSFGSPQAPSKGESGKDTDNPLDQKQSLVKIRSKAPIRNADGERVDDLEALIDKFAQQVNTRLLNLEP